MKKPATTRSRMKLTVWIAAGLTAVAVAAGSLLPPTEQQKLQELSCPELTAEMLKMTGTDATQPYDLERVQMINKAREQKDCGNPFLDPSAR